MSTKPMEKSKLQKIMGFTIIESIFVLLAVLVMAFILAGLYFKHNQLPASDSTGGDSEIAAPGPTS